MKKDKKFALGGVSAINPIRPDMPKTLPTAPVGSGPSVTVDSPVRPDMPRTAPPAPQMTAQQRNALVRDARNTYQQARRAATDTVGRQAAIDTFKSAKQGIQDQYRASGRTPTPVRDIGTGMPPNINKPYAPDINSPLLPGPGMKKGGAAYKDKIDLNQCKVNTVSKKNSSSSKW